MNILGPIILEDASGNLSAQATYTKHPLLRPFQIAFQGTWHIQNRQTADGVWVYRAVVGPSGSCGTDPSLVVS